MFAAIPKISAAIFKISAAIHFGGVSKNSAAIPMIFDDFCCNNQNV